MKIPLKEFEQHIEETILKRGLQYFKKGYVNEPVEIGYGEYEAIVEGTDLITVQLTIKNDVITENVCTCPYDLGPICKHTVAVIFYLQQDELNLNVRKTKKSGSTKTVSKKKTVAEQVDELLEKMSHENLKEYIKEQCVKDSSFRHLFLAKFAFLVQPDSQALYTKQVQAILKSATGRDGWIDYSKNRFVGNAVYELVQKAENLVETSNYKTAMYIACAVLEEMTKALQFADDSNGDIGGCIEPSINILLDIAHQPISEEIRKELFNYCLNTFKIELFKKNCSNSDFRKKIIETAISEKNYNKAIKYALEGIVLDDKDKPGLANDWREYLLKIFIVQNNKDEIIKYA